MTEITQPEELLKLHERICTTENTDLPAAKENAHIAWLERQTKKTFWQNLFHDEEFGSDEYNQAYSTLPSSINISPEIALVLADDQKKYQSQKDKVISNGYRNLFTFAGKLTLAAIFPTPHTAASAAYSFGKAILKESEHKEVLAELEANRDQITAKILSLYALTEDGVGGYKLERGHWDLISHVVGSGQGQHVEAKMGVRRCGIVPTFDYAKLQSVVQDNLSKADRPR